MKSAAGKIDLPDLMQVLYSQKHSTENLFKERTKSYLTVTCQRRMSNRYPTPPHMYVWIYAYTSTPNIKQNKKQKIAHLNKSITTPLSLNIPNGFRTQLGEDMVELAVHA